MARKESETNVSNFRGLCEYWKEDVNFTLSSLSPYHIGDTVKSEDEGNGGLLGYKGGQSKRINITRGEQGFSYSYRW